MQNLELTKTKDGKTAVQCSTLYKALELNPTQYARWIEKNIINNPFGINGEDYTRLTIHKGEIRETETALTPHKDGIRNENPILSRLNGEIRNTKTSLRQKRTRNRSRNVDFILTLDFSKRLAMMTRTEKGEAVRRYFLDCEKRLQNIQTELFAELEAYRELEAIREQRRILNAKARQCRQRIKIATETIHYIQLILNFID